MPDDNNTPRNGDEPREEEARDIVSEPVPASEQRIDQSINALEALARKEIRRSVSPPKESSIISKKKSRHLVDQLESVERLRKAQFVELTIDPDVPPEEALREIEEIYTSNLVPDSVFFLLSQGAQYDMLRSLHQGMLHRFHPTPQELALYPPGYESVRMQMYRDMLGGTDRPGEYRVFGLRDETGALRAWESFRIPSRDPEKMRRYEEYLDRTLFNPQSVHLEENIIPKLKKANHRLIEFDTANICKDWNMAGTLLLWKSLMRLQEEFGEADMPKGLFFYRFVGLTPIDPKPSGDDDFDLDLGTNDSTARAARRWGCTDIGYRFCPDDHIIRAGVPNATRPIQIAPKWRYSSAKVSIMMDMCYDYLAEHDLLPNEES